MELLPLSLLAGLLTILAPCVFTVLPVILNGSIEDKNKLRPLVIVGSLGLSTLIFTILLKAGEQLLMIPETFWRYFSGVIIIFFALTILFPDLWTKINIALGLYKSEKAVHANQNNKSLKSAVILGMSLGPVFNSCSPTYLLLTATIFPQSFSIAMINIIAYIIGFMIPLLLIGYGGQKIVNKLKWAANPNGLFKKILGVILLLTGVAIITSFDKEIEKFILNELEFTTLVNFEQELLDNVSDQFTE
jgi:cytochrome c biogenesis protein CcdA